jgi:hypothetical protein
MADETASDQTQAALDELRAILDALTTTAERLYGLPDGTVARCPR